jgi:virginiamycin A acetyltransferase
MSAAPLAPDSPPGPPAGAEGAGPPTAPPRPPEAPSGRLRRLAKGLGVVLGLIIAAPAAATCWLEARLSGRDEVYLFWAQAFALVPGLPGKYARKGFYHWTLQAYAVSAEVGFLSIIHDRRAEIGERAYIGGLVGIGLVSLGEGCLLGSRVSLLSGSKQHQLGPDGRLPPFDRSRARRIRLGPHTWVGEGAIVMADVGGRCIVGGGSVVSQPVPDGCLVAGNPARLIRRLVDEPTKSGPDSPPPVATP